jgi:hypothetical protein
MDTASADDIRHPPGFPTEWSLEIDLTDRLDPGQSSARATDEAVATHDDQPDPTVPSLTGAPPGLLSATALLDDAYALLLDYHRSWLTEAEWWEFESVLRDVRFAVLLTTKIARAYQQGGSDLDPRRQPMDARVL